MKKKPKQQKKSEPSEVSEMFQMLREEIRERNNEKRAWSHELLEDFVVKHEIEMKELQPWQIRLTKQSINVRYDIYPTRNRWHNLSTQERGGFTNLIGFLEKAFFVEII